jgi:FtsP/CotA-like multicopper oxidase with cupredoxin domain/plastocyanin
MAEFSIKIVRAENGLTGFQPDLPWSKVGDPALVAPNSIVSWYNQTDDPHQVEVIDVTDVTGGKYTSNKILPQYTSRPGYVTPASGSVSYRCKIHQGETGTIVVQQAVPMPPINPVVVLFFAIALSAFSAHPARGQATPTPTPTCTPPPLTIQTPCLPPQQPLVTIPEIISKDGRLRATLIATTELVRMPVRSSADGKPLQPGDSNAFQACYPQWVRAFRSPDTTTPIPPPPTNCLLDPFPGPTLRARVGDFIELTLINEIDPKHWIDSIDTDECDSTSDYPAGTGDQPPDCFHGSTTANLHFHGTHTNPTSTGDNVFLEILSSKRLIGEPPPPPPNFDKFFEACEAKLSKGSHVEWPVVWEDLPQEYRDQQKYLFDRFDQQKEIGKKLWPINQNQIDHQRWPQYYIGSFPYCFRLPKYPEPTATPGSTKGAGSAEMQAHGGMDAAAVVQQGGPLLMGQSPGTHWYHAHKHGSTAIDVANGFVGAFIIEGQYDEEINTVYEAFAPPGMPWTRNQPVLVINQFGFSPNLMTGGAGQDKGPDFSVNGRTNPVITMQPGEVQMWRIVNASGRAGAFFLTPPPGLNWRILARDGVQLHPDNYVATTNLNSSFLLAAGNRIDLLVQAGSCTTPNGCSVNVQNMVDPSDLQGAPKISLLTVNVAGDPKNMPFPDKTSPAKTFPADLNDITDNEIRGTQVIDFGTVPPAPGGPPKKAAAIHTINGKKFDGEVGMSVLLNKVEEWKVTNNSSNISHPFHIHINPFQVTEVFSPNEPLLDPKTGKPYVDPKTGKPVLDRHTNQPVAKYVFWKDENVVPGQCYLDPGDPNSWVPMTWMPGPAGSAGSCVPTPHQVQTHHIWWDVFPIPSGYNPTLLNDADKSKTPLTYKDKDNKVKPIRITGYFKLRSRFVDYPGYYVIHCHILAHEDRGMMTVVEVTPRLSPYSHH